MGLLSAVRLYFYFCIAAPFIRLFSFIDDAKSFLAIECIVCVDKRPTTDTTHSMYSIAFARRKMTITFSSMHKNSSSCLSSSSSSLRRFAFTIASTFARHCLPNPIPHNGNFLILWFSNKIGGKLVQLLAPRLPLTSVSKIFDLNRVKHPYGGWCVRAASEGNEREASAKETRTRKSFSSDFFYRLLFSVAVATSIIIYLFSSYRRRHLYKFFMRFRAALCSMTSYGLQFSRITTHKTRMCRSVCAI